MAYASPFCRLAVIGTGYGDEMWTWTLSLIDPGGPWEAPTEVPAGIVSAVQTFHQSTLISKAAKLQSIKLNLIGEDGRYVDQDDTVVHDFPTPIAGGGNFNTAAFMTTAVTLDTEARRGYASKGRFYPPYIAMPTEDNGQVPVASAQSLADQAATMINSINGDPFGWVVGVTSSVGGGAQRRVTGVRVGRVQDVQRRRKNRLLEAHVDSTVDIVP